MWPSTVRTERVSRCGDRAVGQPLTDQHHDLSVPDRSAVTARRPDEAPGCWRPRIVRPALLLVSRTRKPIHAGPGGDRPWPRARMRRGPQRGRPCARIPQTPRPVRRRRRRAGPRRTGPQDRRGAPRRSLPARADRGALEWSPNCVAVCKQITSAANCPLARAVSAADNDRGDRLTDRTLAGGHPRRASPRS